MSEVWNENGVRLIQGDVAEAATLEPIETGSVRTIVTSPPYYGLRDYGVAEQLGAEATVEEYVDRLVGVFETLKRVLADDGTLWLNLGDSYAAKARGNDEGWDKSRLTNPARVQKAQSAALRRTGERARGAASGIAPKNLMGVPWRVAFALQNAGWILRSDIVWNKPNPMPEPVVDRPTRSHEYLFLLAKSPRYFYDGEAVAEQAVGSKNSTRGRRLDHMIHHGNAKSPQWDGGDTRNMRDVWTTPTVPFSEAHFAVYPPELIRPCIRAGSALGDTVLDPFSGSGTTGMVARQEGRNYIGIDLNREYLDLSLRTRFAQPVLDMWGGAA